uniref:Uncharacterized protein n=1 Tax=Fundulus heteroclitus TaxID=8078 RepID=A0A3Q2PRU2_FUNHE
MAQQTSAWRRYMQAFISGFFVAVPVTVTLLDKLAYVARVEGASMQVRLYDSSSLPKRNSHIAPSRTALKKIHYFTYLLLEIPY